MKRSQPRQHAPDPARVDASFPAVSGRPRVVYRAGGVDSNSAPWPPGWFASDGNGRFDLTEHARPDRPQGPGGTLYVARSRHSAVMERVGETLAEAPAVPHALASQVHIWALAPLVRLQLADLDAENADQLGVTGELAAGSDYPTYQVWAARFDDVGFDGISYHPRFTTSKRATMAAWAVFGIAGAHLGPFRRLERAPDLLSDIAAEIGVLVELPAATREPPSTHDDLLL